MEQWAGGCLQCMSPLMVNAAHSLQAAHSATTSTTDHIISRQIMRIISTPIS